MKPFFRASALAACLLFASTGSHALEPRELAERVAKAVDEHYFDETRAPQIAAELRAAADRGEWDALTDPAELGAALSRFLEPKDGHFNVSWSADDPIEPTEPAPPPAAPVNHGVHGVQMLAGGVGVLDLRFFPDLSFDDPTEAARHTVDAALDLLNGAKAVVIDLRRTPGGSPAAVGYIGSAFLAPGTEAFNTFHGRGGRRMSEAPAQWHARPRVDVPLFVLVSGRTGSAAESFAYTLQQAGRARVVGEASYGAANPGGQVGLGEGWSVFVSMATPINPKTGTNWEKVGVLPDIAAASDGALDVAHQHALQALLTLDVDTAEARWVLEGLRAPTDNSNAADELLGRYEELSVERGQEGGLQIRRERRLTQALRPLAVDSFVVIGAAELRIEFERDAQGQVIALTQRRASGERIRFKRSAQVVTETPVGVASTK
jgi:hypothetical protein